MPPIREVASYLSIVSESHIFAHSQHSLGIGALLDVDTSSMNLVIEAKSLVGVNSALSQGHGLTSFPQQDHLPILLVQVDNTLKIVRQLLQHEVGYFLVVHSGNKCTCVNEDIEIRGGANISEE